MWGVTHQTGFVLLVMVEGCRGGEVVVLPCGTAEGRKKLFEQGWIKKRCELTGAKSPCCSWAGKFVKNVK